MTKQDIEEFVQAIIDDLRDGKGRHDALQNWVSNRADGKANAASEFFSKHRDTIDALFLGYKNAP